MTVLYWLKWDDRVAPVPIFEIDVVDELKDDPHLVGNECQWIVPGTEDC